MDRCLSFADLDALLEDRLAPRERSRVESHLAACSKCRGDFSALQRDASFLADAGEILHDVVEQETVTGEKAARATAGGRMPRIDGYIVKQLIGRGGMAAVYEAEQLKLKRTVALKLLSAVAGTAQPSLVTRFKREATAAAKLHHTNIIPIYDFGESRDGYYYAMEMIHGPTLRDMIRRLAAASAPDISAAALAALIHETCDSSQRSAGSPDGVVRGGTDDSQAGTSSTGGRARDYYRQIAHWIADVADALHFAHVNGVIHRDIKPANLMLSTDGRMMVADFGLAKTSGDDSVTISGSLLGTYRYMSPEQIGAKRLKVDARTDVYSLGATLYELLTFQPAFGATDREELFGQIMFQEPGSPRRMIPGIPSEMQTICQKAMEKSPDARYATARDMAEDLRRFMADLPIVARSPGLLGRARKFVRRHKTASLVLSILLVALVIIGVVWADRQRALGRQIDAQIARAALALEKDDFEVAADTYRAVLQADPRNIRALGGMAIACKETFYRTQDSRRLMEAESFLEQAFAVDPDRVRLLDYSGVLKRIRGDYATAEEIHARVIQEQPDYYAAYVNRGTALALLYRLEESEASLAIGARLAGEQDVVGAMAWRNLGIVQLCRASPGAITSLEQARAQPESDIYSFIMLARVHLESAEHLDAQRALHLAITAAQLQEGGKVEAGDDSGEIPEIPEVSRILALAQLRSGDWGDARVSATRAIAAGDCCPAAAHLVRGLAAAEEGALDAAAEDLVAAKACWPASLDRCGYFVTTLRKRSVLWVESARVLDGLRRELEQRLAG